MANDPLTPGAPAQLRVGFGAAGVLIGLAVLALVAIVAFVVVSHNRDAALHTEAVTSASSSLAGTPAAK